MGKEIKYNSTLNLEEAKNHIISWMSDYMIQSRQKRWIIGVSGGIDSALASTLCAETGCPVVCVEMPIHQNDSHVSRVKKHIEWLKSNYYNVSSIEVDLTDAFDTLSKTFSKSNKTLLSIDEETEELALANTRSRLRMIGLYYYSNRLQGLVCGTGNKVEDFGIGFFSVGGDGQVDISPIADLVKSEVRAMANILGVSDEIINAIPSDGLWDDSRSDEEQVGAKYDELEWAMSYLETNPENNDALTPRELEVLEIYQKRHNATKYKMESIPVCYLENLRD